MLTVGQKAVDEAVVECDALFVHWAGTLCGGEAELALASGMPPYMWSLSQCPLIASLLPATWGNIAACRTEQGAGDVLPHGTWGTDCAARRATHLAALWTS